MNKKEKEPTKPCSRVVSAVIVEGGKYLCMQRSRSRYGYITERWEFPGGKVEEGESDHEALVREIREEMDWDVFVGPKLGQVVYEYPDFSIDMTAYLCRGGAGDFKMLEHLDCKWLPREELDALNWTEADRELLKQI